MTAPAQQQSARLAAYSAAVAAVRSRVLGFLTLRWGLLTAWRDADADALVSAVLPVVLAGQRQISTLTDAFLTQVSGGAAAGVPAAAVTGAAVRSGVPPAEVYRRPFVTVWTSLSQGKQLPLAVSAGGKRLTDLGATDLQLAKTHTAQRVLGGQHVVGYRRVIAGTHTCALCLLASTVRYHKADLMPIHPGCDCGIDPLFAGDSPAAVSPEAVHAAVARDLGEKYVRAGGRGPVDYRDILVTHQHGELGPVLGVRGQDFTGPPEIQ